MASESVRLPDEMSDALAQLAVASGRSKSLLMVDAIQDFIEREAWLAADLEKAIAEADAEKFATEDEMQAVLKKWVTGAS